MMKNIPNWGRNSNFNYEGSVKEGTTIYINNGGSFFLSAKDYQKIIIKFHGKKVKAGTPYDKPPKGSVGSYMLEQKMTTSCYMTYIGAILEKEGYAYKDGADIIFK